MTTGNVTPMLSSISRRCSLPLLPPSSVPSAKTEAPRTSGDASVSSAQRRSCAAALMPAHLASSKSSHSLPRQKAPHLRTFELPSVSMLSAIGSRLPERHAHCPGWQLFMITVKTKAAIVRCVAGVRANDSTWIK